MSGHWTPKPVTGHRSRELSGLGEGFCLSLPLQLFESSILLSSKILILSQALGEQLGGVCMWNLSNLRHKICTLAYSSTLALKPAWFPFLSFCSSIVYFLCKSSCSISTKLIPRGCRTQTSPTSLFRLLFRTWCQQFLSTRQWLQLNPGPPEMVHWL